MRIIVSGSRYFDDYATLCNVIDRVLEMNHLTIRDVMMINGGARGCDSLVFKYSIERCCPVVTFPANWDFYGKSAGPIRNQQMLDFALEGKAILIAFPLGESRGTRGMIKMAQKKNIPVFIYENGEIKC